MSWLMYKMNNNEFWLNMIFFTEAFKDYVRLVYQKLTIREQETLINKVAELRDFVKDKKYIEKSEVIK